jgi:hypothetical protein
MRSGTSPTGKGVLRNWKALSHICITLKLYTKLDEYRKGKSNESVKWSETVKR